VSPLESPVIGCGRCSRLALIHRDGDGTVFTCPVCGDVVAKMAAAEPHVLITGVNMLVTTLDRLQGWQVPDPIETITDTRPYCLRCGAPHDGKCLRGDDQ
jgi:hypothetical protein